MPPCIHGAFEKIWGGGQFRDQYVGIKSQRDVIDCDFGHRLWQKPPQHSCRRSQGKRICVRAAAPDKSLRFLLRLFFFKQRKKSLRPTLSNICVL